jgi:hypothetical protein
VRRVFGRERLGSRLTCVTKTVDTDWPALGVLALLIVQASLAFAGPAGVRALPPLLALFVVAAAACLAADARSGTNVSS